MQGIITCQGILSSQACVQVIHILIMGSFMTQLTNSSVLVYQVGVQGVTSCQGIISSQACVLGTHVLIMGSSMI